MPHLQPNKSIKAHASAPSVPHKSIQYFHCGDCDFLKDLIETKKGKVFQQLFKEGIKYPVIVSGQNTKELSHSQSAKKEFLNCLFNLIVLSL